MRSGGIRLQRGFYKVTHLENRGKVADGLTIEGLPGEPMQLKFTFVCRRCGNDEILIPDGPEDGDYIACGNCKTRLCSKIAFDEKTKQAAEKAGKEQIQRILAGKPELQDPLSSVSNFRREPTHEGFANCKTLRQIYGPLRKSRGSSNRQERVDDR